MSGPPTIQSISRALDALEFLSASEVHDTGASLQATAEYIGVASTTAHNILKTLVTRGYARQDEQRLYRLGPRCQDLARAHAFGHGALETAQAVVDALTQQTGESVVLAVLLGGRRHPLLRAEGTSAVRVSAAFEEPGRLFDLVTGRILAAYASADELGMVIDIHGYPRDAWDGIASREQLDAALSEIRSVGLAEDHSLEQDVWAMSAPVLQPDGSLLAALGLFLPAYRATEDRLAQLRDALFASAARIRNAATSTED